MNPEQQIAELQAQIAAAQAQIAQIKSSVAEAKAQAVPEGMHKMPDGSLMADAEILRMQLRLMKMIMLKKLEKFFQYQTEIYKAIEIQKVILYKHQIKVLKYQLH